MLHRADPTLRTLLTTSRLPSPSCSVEDSDALSSAWLGRERGSHERA